MKSRQGWSDEAISKGAAELNEFLQGPGYALLLQEMRERLEPHEKYLNELSPSTFDQSQIMYNTGFKAGAKTLNEAIEKVRKMGKEANDRIANQ